MKLVFETMIKAASTFLTTLKPHNDHYIININIKMILLNILLLVIVNSQYNDDKEKGIQRICHKVDVSSDVNKYSNDMVRSGVTSLEWSDDSTVPVIIGPDK